MSSYAVPQTLRENDKIFSTRNVEELVCSNSNVPQWNLPLKYYGPKKKRESVEEDPKQNNSTERLDLAQTGAQFFVKAPNNRMKSTNLPIVLPIADRNLQNSPHRFHIQKK